MKKTPHHIALILALIFAGSTVAQEGFRIGAKGAVQSTWLINKTNSDDADYAYISTLGPSAGLALDYHFTPTVGLELDVLYSSQGQRADIAFGDPTYEIHQKLSYLKFPLMLAINSDPSGGSTMFMLRIGPQFSMLNSAEFVDVETGVFSDSDNKNTYESLDIGAVLSIGAAIPVSDAVQITTCFRADYNFTNAEDESYVGYDETRSPTANATGGIEIGVNYLFRKYTGGSDE